MVTTVTIQHDGSRCESRLGSFCVELACSSFAFVGFLFWVLASFQIPKTLHVRLISGSELTVSLISHLRVVCLCVSPLMDPRPLHTQKLLWSLAVLGKSSHNCEACSKVKRSQLCDTLSLTTFSLFSPSCIFVTFLSPSYSSLPSFYSFFFWHCQSNACVLEDQCCTVNFFPHWMLL